MYLRHDLTNGDQTKMVTGKLNTSLFLKMIPPGHVDIDCWKADVWIECARGRIPMGQTVLWG